MEKLKSYLLENLDELKGVVSEINAYNGSLDYLEVWENEAYSINELFFNNPYEALRSSYYGYYNINDPLVRFNGYGNIETLTNEDYNVDIQNSIDEIICELVKIYNKIDISEELHGLIEKFLRKCK